MTSQCEVFFDAVDDLLKSLNEPAEIWMGLVYKQVVGGSSNWALQAEIKCNEFTGVLQTRCPNDELEEAEERCKKYDNISKINIDILFDS